MYIEHIEAFDIRQLPAGKHRLSLTFDTIRLPVLCVKGNAEAPHLVVFGGVHGDEYIGVEAILNLYEELDPQAIAGTVVMVPVANPPAFDAGLRTSPIDGKNLARLFPGDPNGTLSDRIAYWLTEKFITGADFLIDLHTGGTNYAIPPLIGYVDAPTPFAQRSRAAAAVFGAPTIWGHPLPVPPGRSISAAWDLGVPALYTEAPEEATARTRNVSLYQDGVLNIMSHLSMIDRPVQSVESEYHLIGNGDLDKLINAPVTGYFRPYVRLLDDIQVGQPIGVIRDISGGGDVEVLATHDGLIILLRQVPYVHAGVGIAHIVQQKRKP